MARKIQLKLDNLLHRMMIVFRTFGKTKSESSELPLSLPLETFSELQVKIQAAEFCNTSDINAVQVCVWEEEREGMLGEGEGSVRVSQGDYTGEEGWEIEVCNWLPGED